MMTLIFIDYQKSCGIWQHSDYFGELFFDHSAGPALIIGSLPSGLGVELDYSD